MGTLIKVEKDSVYSEPHPNDIRIVQDQRYCNYKKREVAVCNIECSFYKFDDYSECLLKLSDGGTRARVSNDVSGKFENRQLCSEACPGNGDYEYERIFQDGEMLFRLKRMRERNGG